MLTWKKIKRGLRTRVIKRWGSERSKAALWDEEFARGQWDYLENTRSDPIYTYLERYARNGNILDLGCGSGNTSSELNYTAYRSYTGVDISAVAVEKAATRCRKDGRQSKNSYVRGEIETFVPNGTYDVILFRESLFYIPCDRIEAVLDRYSSYLTRNGVIIVRMCDQEKYAAIGKLIISTFRLLERHSSAEYADVIFVFRPSD